MSVQKPDGYVLHQGNKLPFFRMPPKVEEPTCDDCGEPVSACLCRDSDEENDATVLQEFGLLGDADTGNDEG